MITPHSVESRAAASSAARGPAPYRVLITGSRTWRDHQPIHQALAEIHEEHPTMLLISGACAQGTDAIAERWAHLNGVPVERHPAEWTRYGKSAGPRRNAHMVQLGADLALAFIHGNSAGATHCARLAEYAGITVRRWQT
jgi:hypothetical protein